VALALNGRPRRGGIAGGRDEKSDVSGGERRKIDLESPEHHDSTIQLTANRNKAQMSAPGTKRTCALGSLTSGSDPKRTL
jgi:hypothetical protein